jgi:hypothetical protein
VSWELADGEQEIVLALSARERYGYFVQLAVDSGETWGLKNDEGWVLACAVGDWAKAVPQPIALDELLADLIPILEEDGISVAVFPGTDGDSAVVDPKDLRHDLETEIELGAGEEADPEHEHDSEE